MNRLTVGLVIVGAIALTSFVMAPLNDVPPGADPVRTAMAPPGTRITTLVLDDGSFLASVEAEFTPGSVILIHDGTRTEIDRQRIAALDEHLFLLGSDRFGRDVFGMMLSGGRISLLIAALSLAITLLVGIAVGMSAATGGRIVDSLLMRLVDGMLAFPTLFLLILVGALFRPGATTLILVLGFTSWMSLARLVRGQVLSLRSRPFVLAAHTAGSPWYRIWSYHYAPNIVGPVSQDAAMRMGDLILAEATLSFLGLGVPHATPTWGWLVNEGHRTMLDAWWLATFPGMAIAALVIGFALIGDGLQERMQGNRSATLVS